MSTDLIQVEVSGSCGDCLSFDVVCLEVCFQDISGISWVQGSVTDATHARCWFSLIFLQPLHIEISIGP
jgi:hypothetical protein